MRDPRAAIVFGAIAFAIAALPVRADDAAAGYADIRPSLVKVWSFDASGRPFQSGSGIVIVSNHERSLVLTAGHVVAGAAAVKIDIDRDRHDIVARVEQRGPRDLAILAIDRGDLRAAVFASRSHAVVEGNVIAVAGFVKHDELIGIVGQEPRLLYPGTISSRPDDGAYLELENVHVEEGLSGGPVFDPDTGQVLGIVTSRTSDQRGGFADSAALVVVPFLASSAIPYREAGAPLVVLAAPPAPKPRSTAAPSPAARSTPRPKPHTATAPVPVPAHPAVAVAVVPPPAASPPPKPAGPQVWEAQDATPHRLAYDRGACAIVLSISISRLAFTLPAGRDGGDPTNADLRVRVARRVAPVAACDDVPASDPSDGRYEAAATSFDGRHVTIRFRYVPDAGANADAEATIFPSDVSVDADVTQAPVTAHVQLIDADWDGALDVVASRDR